MRSKSVMLKINEHGDVPVDDLQRWRSIVPEWFLNQCGPDMTKEESARLQALPIEERLARSREGRWGFSDWIFCFQPEERFWFWWDATELSNNELFIYIDVIDWPYPWDELSWLLRASGARSFYPQRQESE